MKTPTELPRRKGLARLAAGALVALGVSLAAVSPAAADDDDWNGHKHWKKHGHYYDHGYYPYGHHKHHKHKHRPKVVYYPQPVYVAPPPPVYYYQPAPVYYGRPNVSIVFPIDLD